MNNEINKSHEEILEKYKRTFDNVHYWYQREEILQAMAEGAGLRDKEVKGIVSKEREKWNKESLKFSERWFLGQITNWEEKCNELQQQLTAKDKEIERLEMVIKEFGDYEQEVEANYAHKDMDIEQLKAKINAFMNPLKDTWDNEADKKWDDIPKESYDDFIKPLDKPIDI